MLTPYKVCNNPRPSAYICVVSLRFMGGRLSFHFRFKRKPLPRSPKTVFLSDWKCAWYL